MLHSNIEDKVNYFTTWSSVPLFFVEHSVYAITFAIVSSLYVGISLIYFKFLEC
jgi:hypothetical protein